MSFYLGLQNTDSELKQNGYNLLIQADIVIHRDDYSDTLTITQTISSYIVHNSSITQTLTLSSIISNNELYNLIISQSLVLADSIVNNKVRSRLLSDTLIISQIISNTTRIGILSQSLVLSQTITENQGFAESISQSLVLSQTITENQGYTEPISQSLILSQTITENQGYTEPINQSLVLIQTISYILNIIHEESVNQTLDLDQFANNYISNLHQHITHNLIFNNTFTKPLDIHSIVTNINGHIIAIPTVTAVVIPICSVVLSVSDLSIVLPCPLFGDTQANISSLNHKRTMTGLTYSYVKNSTLNKLSYRFELSRIKTKELLNFLKLNMSKPIIMYNWKGETWYSYITNNPIDMITKGLWNHPTCATEYNEVVLDFEGNKL